MKHRLTVLMIALLVVASSAAYRQAKEKKSDPTYVFDVVKKLPATSVKNQYR